MTSPFSQYFQINQLKMCEQDLALFNNLIAKNPVRLFFDTETTGLGNADRIINMCIVECDFQTMKMRYFESLFNPEGRSIAPGAFAVHKISSQSLKYQPTFAQIAGDILEFVNNRTLIAHNKQFDKRMLNNELARCSHNLIANNKFECTLEMARIAFPGLKNSLQDLCERFNVDHSNRTVHGALIDTLLLAQIYPHLLVKYTKNLPEIQG